MTVQLRTRNITRVYRDATDTDRAEGTSWYRNARALAEELDPRDPVRAAAVIAVLSPRISWGVNARLARQAYGQYRASRPIDAPWVFQLPCLRANSRKVLALLNGADPDTVVSGPKVRAFWHAIVNPSDPRAIVIDRHAFDVAAGEVLDDERRGKLLGRKGAYDGVCDLYTRAARILTKEYGSLTPVEVQATTWVTWRRLKKGRS